MPDMMTSTTGRSEDTFIPGLWAQARQSRNHRGAGDFAKKTGQAMRRAGWVETGWQKGRR